MRKKIILGRLRRNCFLKTIFGADLLYATLVVPFAHVTQRAELYPVNISVEDLKKMDVL
jgi:hypothetical protein